MLSAYVLIESEVGKVAHVAQAMTELDGVQLAEDLAGPYDVIARIQASSLDELNGRDRCPVSALPGPWRLEDQQPSMLLGLSRVVQRHRVYQGSRAGIGMGRRPRDGGT